MLQIYPFHKKTNYYKYCKRGYLSVISAIKCIVFKKIWSFPSFLLLLIYPYIVYFIAHGNSFIINLSTVYATKS